MITKKREINTVYEHRVERPLGDRTRNQTIRGKVPIQRGLERNRGIRLEPPRDLNRLKK